MISKVEAAFIILKEYKKPLSYDEIIKLSIEKGLISTKGKTPAATLRVDVYNENKRRKSRGKEIRFDNSVSGYLSLKEF